MDVFEIAPGEKYAIIALPDCSISDALPDQVQLADGVWATRQLPVPVDEHWSDWLGSLLVERLESAQLYLVCVARSSSLSILDDENVDLEDRVWRLYWGLLLTDFARIGERPLRLTGARGAHGIDVRSVEEIEQPRFVLGSPIVRIESDHLKCADEIGENLKQLRQQQAHRRIWQINHAFYAGVTEPDWGNRLHQFVRCVEGFILPDTGKSARQFKSRGELFVGGRHHQLMGELYEIRSSVEHLHSPWAAIPADSERERRLIVYRRTIESEALARYCLRSFVLNPDAWNHFLDDAALAAFWKRSADDRQSIWGDPMDLRGVSDLLDEEIVTDDELGL